MFTYSPNTYFKHSQNDKSGSDQVQLLIGKIKRNKKNNTYKNFNIPEREQRKINKNVLFFFHKSIRIKWGIEKNKGNLLYYCFNLKKYILITSK